MSQPLGNGSTQGPAAPAQHWMANLSPLALGHRLSVWFHLYPEKNVLQGLGGKSRHGDVTSLGGIYKASPTPRPGSQPRVVAPHPTGCPGFVHPA